MATPTDPLSEPAAEPPVAAEAARLSLKVRTLDQKTYPITICAAASVPQLKEVVAAETGITLARQRLIYRGRVLKNDQSLAAYSLEDGHVLHLVVRAAPLPSAGVAAAGHGSADSSAPDADAGQAGRASDHTAAAHQYLATGFSSMNGMDALNARLDELQRLSQRARSRSRQRRTARMPLPPTDNDEPDPTMGRPGGGIPSRVLMGATISVPEGANVTMPFLSSMIANLVTQVHEGGVEGEGVTTGTAADGRHHVSFSSEALGGVAAAEMGATAARALRHHRRNRDGSGSTGRQRHGRRSFTGAGRQEALRVRTGVLFASMRATLDDASLNFPAELAALPQGGDNAAMAELQQQVEMLLTLLERFGPRLRLLPAALAQRDRLTERSALAASGTAPVESASGSSSTPNTTNDPAEPTVSTRHVIRAIETLQSIGEATDLLARMVRHAFVHQPIQLREPIPYREDAAGAANLGATTAGDGVDAAMQAASRTAGAHATTGDRVIAAMHAAARSEGGVRPRFRVSRVRAMDLLGERTITASRTGNTAPGSTPGFPVDLTGSSTRAAPPVPQLATSADSSRPNTRADAAPNNSMDPQLPAGARISIPGIGGLPLMSSVVFPYSLAAGLGGSHATTTWNLADFVSRLTSELPISTIYGVMAGDATHLHQIMAHIGFALFSGVDVPRISRPNLRAWAQDLVDELRRLLRSNALPADVLDQVNGETERRSALGNELLRVMEPFIPDLIDYLVRATSASRVAAFGTSSSTFLRTMVRQVVHQLRSYARDSTESEDESDERLKRLLRGLLIWFGMNEHMAGFVVDSLLCWTEGDGASSRRGRTRQREDATSGAGATDSSATKRRRE
ncbi:hypothetical protein KRP22_011261 [Phytophthora ramorum]|nr:Ubiquitin-like domain-containing protein CIP73 [Phytophthora ramorum]